MNKTYHIHLTICNVYVYIIYIYVYFSNCFLRPWEMDVGSQGGGRAADSREWGNGMIINSYGLDHFQLPIRNE